MIEKTHRIYRTKPWQGESPHISSPPHNLQPSRRSTEAATRVRSSSGRYALDISMFEVQHEKALETYGPRSIIINKNHMVLHVSENAGRYLLQKCQGNPGAY